MLEWKPCYLFVYGTMMAGQRNHARLEFGGARSLGTAVTDEARYLLLSRDTGAGYLAPAALVGGQKRIRGELYDVDPALLDEIDDCEGHPTVYRRTPVLLHGHESKETWMYLYVGMDRLDSRGIHTAETHTWFSA